MSTPRLARCASICLGWLVATAMAFNCVAGTPITGSLYYTRDGGPATVASISFRYDGTNSFQVISNAVIASLPSADGLLIAPDGDLLVGDCNDSGTLYKVNPFTGTVVSAPSNGGACHPEPAWCCPGSGPCPACGITSREPATARTPGST